MNASTGNIIDEMVNSIKHEIDQLEGEYLNIVKVD